MTERKPTSETARKRTNTSLTKDIGQTVPSTNPTCQPIPRDLKLSGMGCRQEADLGRRRSLPMSRRTTCTSNGSIRVPTLFLFPSRDATCDFSLPSAQESGEQKEKSLHDTVQSQRSTSGIVGSRPMQICSNVQEGCR